MEFSLNKNLSVWKDALPKFKLIRNRSVFYFPFQCWYVVSSDSIDAIISSMGVTLVISPSESIQRELTGLSNKLREVVKDRHNIIQAYNQFKSGIISEFGIIFIPARDKEILEFLKDYNEQYKKIKHSIDDCDF